MMNTDDQRDLTGRRGPCSPWPIVPGSLFQRFLKGVAQRVQTDQWSTHRVWSFCGSDNKR